MEVMSMEVLDIVQSAAFKAGIISSFNPDEVPGDIVDAGRKVLTDEILPTLNCDRTIDITMTSRVYTPKNGIIKLTPLTQPKENFKIIGYSAQTVENYDPLPDLKRLVPLWLDAGWPINDFDEPIMGGIWLADNTLMTVKPDGKDTYKTEPFPNVNIDFPPMRIDAVLEDNSRIPYTYTYRDEFERILKTAFPGVYTTEEYADSIIVLINGPDTPKRLVIPVPLQIINQDHTHAGTIIAPEKFRRYLIDTTAVSLAIIYGVATLPVMQQQAGVSYNLLKKNKTQPLHKANPSEELNNKLRRTRRWYGNF